MILSGTRWKTFIVFAMKELAMPEIQDLWITSEEIAAMTDLYNMGKPFEVLSIAERTKIARQVSGRWASFSWLPAMEPEPQTGMTYARALDSALATAFASHMRWLTEQSGSAFSSAMKERPTRQVSFLSDVPVTVRNALTGNYIYDPLVDETGLNRQRERGRATGLSL